MRKALIILSAIFGGLYVLIGLSHLALGPSVIPGSVPVNANMDSEDRFYASIFIGYGLAMIWASRDLEARRDFYLALMGISFLGGIARIISMLAVGMPDTFFVVLTANGLLMPIICVLWLNATSPKPKLFQGD